MNQVLVEIIDSEIFYQMQKHPHSELTVGEWLLVMGECLRKAKQEWNTNGNIAALHEVRQIVACGCRAMEGSGPIFRGTPIQNGLGQDDLPVRESLVRGV